MRIIQCNKCKKRYRANVQDTGKAQSKYRCTECGHQFIVKNPKSSTFSGPNIAENGTAQPKNIIQLAKQKIKIDDRNSTPSSKAEEERAMGLRTKFNLAIGVVFLCAMVLCYFLAGTRLQEDAKEQVFEKAHLLLTTMEASRNFTSKVIKPALYKAAPGRFITEGMSSSFGARNIFERIRKSYPQYYFKHAAPFPRNKLNQADEFEMRVIRNFTNDPNLKEWRGYRTKGDGNEYSIMKPIVAKQRCMRCHSEPSKAPQELLDRYGPKDGFGRSVGEVIGTLTVSVPASVVLDKARKNTMIFMVIVAGFFGLLTLLVNILFTRLILTPIRNLADHANEISLGRLDTKIDTSGGDEIAVLAKAFNRMKMSIKIAFEHLSK